MKLVQISNQDPHKVEALRAHMTAGLVIWPLMALRLLVRYAYPPTHWRHIRTNNPLERIIREITLVSPLVLPKKSGACFCVAAKPRQRASIIADLNDHPTDCVTLESMAIQRI